MHSPKLAQLKLRDNGREIFLFTKYGQFLFVWEFLYKSDVAMQMAGRTKLKVTNNRFLYAVYYCSNINRIGEGTLYRRLQTTQNRLFDIVNLGRSIEVLSLPSIESVI